MTLFKLESKEVLKFAHTLLDDQPDGTKLPHSTPMPSGDKTSCSVIKIKGILYAIVRDELVGEGLFGRVKTVIDENEELSLVKIHKSGWIDTEVEILESLGLSKGSNKRVDSPKSYTHLCYLGNTLDKVLKQLSQDDETTRFKIAIQLCLKVHQLHTGLADFKNHYEYAHLDINPQNITQDKDGCIYLIDFGLSERHPNDILITPKGTDGYFPMGFSRHQKTKRQYDIFALKRVLWMPECVDEEALSVLTKPILEKYDLSNFINNTLSSEANYKNTDSMTACVLAALLINAYFELKVDPNLLYEDEQRSLKLVSQFLTYDFPFDFKLPNTQQAFGFFKMSEDFPLSQTKDKVSINTL